MTMIENSDRGFTINKGLAWTMMTALLVAGVWLGSEITSTKVALTNTDQSFREVKDDLAALRARVDDRLNLVEVSRARDGGELQALRRDLTDFRAEMRELKTLLQRVTHPPVP